MFTLIGFISFLQNSVYMLVFTFTYKNVNKNLKIITPTLLELSYGVSIIVFSAIAY